jgi:DNA-directed RNA polymerase II subunit RPB2
MPPRRGGCAPAQLINVMSLPAIYKHIKPTTIEAGLKYGLATGNWGIKTSRPRQGVAQVLNRMAYVATLSHMRRVNTAIEKTGKLVQPRKLHATQWGIICPSETPEGVSVGLVKNMALLTTITLTSSSDAVRAEIARLGLRRFDPSLSPQQAIEIFGGGAVRVYVNGDLIGAHADPKTLHAELVALKRAGAISVYTSVSWNVLGHELSVCTEGGRFVRPLLVVNPGGTGLVLDAQPCVQQLRSGSARGVEWHKLVLSGSIEYLDADEANHAIIAMSASQCVSAAAAHCVSAPASASVPASAPASVPAPPATASAMGGRVAPTYTHAEVSPYAMLGVVAGSIPFSDHNQAPRNTYQSAMGKQAIGICAANYRHRFDTMVHVLNYPQKPLVSTHTARILNCDRLPCGMNVVVAIACFTGFNQVDERFYSALVLRTSAVKTVVKRDAFTLHWCCAPAQSKPWSKGVPPPRGGRRVPCIRTGRQWDRGHAWCCLKGRFHLHPPAALPCPALPCPALRGPALPAPPPALRGPRRPDYVIWHGSQVPSILTPP